MPLRYLRGISRIWIYYFFTTVFNFSETAPFSPPNGADRDFRGISALISPGQTGISGAVLAIDKMKSIDLPWKAF